MNLCDRKLRGAEDAVSGNGLKNVFFFFTEICLDLLKVMKYIFFYFRGQMV